MNELQFFLERGVKIVEFDDTKLAKNNWKISKTLIRNPSGGITSNKSTLEILFYFLKDNI
jgi:hypothetical protein